MLARKGEAMHVGQHIYDICETGRKVDSQYYHMYGLTVNFETTTFTIYRSEEANGLIDVLDTTISTPDDVLDTTISTPDDVLDTTISTPYRSEKAIKQIGVLFYVVGEENKFSKIEEVVSDWEKWVSDWEKWVSDRKKQRNDNPK